MAAVNIFIIEKIMTLIFHPLSRFARMGRMNAVILGGCNEKDFRIIGLWVDIVIR